MEKTDQKNDNFNALFFVFGVFFWFVFCISFLPGSKFGIVYKKSKCLKQTIVKKFANVKNKLYNTWQILILRESILKYEPKRLTTRCKKEKLIGSSFTFSQISN